MGNALHRRLTALEDVETTGVTRHVILLGPDEDAAMALADAEAKHGRKDGEPFFIRMVGLKPNSDADPR